MKSHPYLELTDQGDYENVIQRLKTGLKICIILTLNALKSKGTVVWNGFPVLLAHTFPIYIR